MTEAKTVYVTRAERTAARALVERSLVTGRPVSPEIERIAKAERVMVDDVVHYVAR